MSSNNYPQINELPPDPILVLTSMFKASKNPKKVNLGVGAYRDENGDPIILPSVKQATKMIYEASEPHEYSPIEGYPLYRALSQELVYGKNYPQIATAASVSGSGAIYLAMCFIKHLYREHNIYVPDPVWSNTINIHEQVFSTKPKTYKWLNGGSFAFEEFKTFLSERQPHEWILIHPVAHNPTGIDPSREQWDEIANLAEKYQVNFFFDTAYQGFASGDADADAYAIRLFADKKLPHIVTQSYAKSFGLYGERTGCVHVFCGCEQEATLALDLLKKFIRSTYSSNPIFGMRVVQTVLISAHLKKQWRLDLKMMAGRIQEMRHALVDELTRIKCPPPAGKNDWSFIAEQVGMFSYTFLTPSQCESLINDYAIFLVKGSGRISISGLNKHNVAYVASAFKDVITKE